MIKENIKAIWEDMQTAVNYGYSGIDFFDSIPEGLYDIFISFAFDSFQHVVSLYSSKVDVSWIAKKIWRRRT